jgi:ABC-type Fe3+-siderophore transport system permease subunit
MLDSLSVVVLLLLAFLAWSMNVQILALGAVIFLIILARSFAIAAVVIIGMGSLYFFKLDDYWFIIFVVIAGVCLFLSERKGSAGGEAYSPELMRLLGGG